MEILVGAGVPRNPSASALLFPALLGARFETLALPVRRLHLAPGARRYAGHAAVVRGGGWLARFLGWATALPRAGDTIDLVVDIDAHPGRERWTRRFGSHVMRSTLWRDGDLLCERLGAVRFAFALDADDGAIAWRVVRVAALGVPLPARWFAGVRARSFAANDEYAFDVEAAMPVAGLIVRYRGTLTLP